MLALTVGKENNIGWILTSTLLCVALLFISTTASAQASSDTLTYVVKAGDSLSEIGLKFGDISSWMAIYEANKDKISNPDKIFPDQTLKIPAFSRTTRNIFQISDHQKEDSPEPQEKEEIQDSTETLKNFREVFDNVIDQEKQKQQTKSQEIISVNGLEFGGLVVNRTTSKMGRDFFNAFYDQWEAPQETGNFFLEISEQPMPSMGAMVLIKIDNQIVYKTRLQPRNNLMDQTVRKSIAMCYRYLYQQISSTKPMTY